MDLDFILTAGFTTLQLVVFYLIIRLIFVHRFMMSTLDRVSNLTKADIMAEAEQAKTATNVKSWEELSWRYRELDKVSYTAVLLSASRLRPENYWDNTDFLKGSQ